MASHLNLTRLPPESIRELVGVVAAQAGQVTPAFTEQLYQETEGLPFFIFEYLASFPEGREDFALTGWPLPHGVRDLLHSRLDQISETGVQLLQTAAAIGRSFDFDTLREASGRTDEETVYTLETLIHRGLIREALPGLEINSPESLRLLSYDFNHEKLRQLVYGETSLARKRLLHLRIAESLVGRSRGVATSPVLPGKLLSTTNRQARLARLLSSIKSLGSKRAPYTPTPKPWLIFKLPLHWGIRKLRQSTKRLATCTRCSAITTLPSRAWKWLWPSNSPIQLPWLV